MNATRKHFETIEERDNVKKCDFFARDGFTLEKKRVYLAETHGLDTKENPGCHVNLSLYYETHRAITVPFASHADAWEYVKSEGKIDKSIYKRGL
jgi:hypothetical protein